MKSILSIITLTGLVAFGAFAAEPALTIYNQNFAVVRDAVPLELKSGVTEARFVGVTAHVEPDSVILRDPSGRHTLQILEQNYRNDPGFGRSCCFLFAKAKRLTSRKSITSMASRRNNHPGQNHPQRLRAALSSDVALRPAVLRVADGLCFRRIGPAHHRGGRQIAVHFAGPAAVPSLGDDTILKPTLTWLVQANKPGKVEAEVGYITGGMNWHADYNWSRRRRATRSSWSAGSPWTIKAANLSRTPKSN